MTKLEYPIYYLESEDINKSGNITNKSLLNGKPILMMIQASFCGACVSAKVVFQELARTHPEIICLTILGDGSKDEVDLAKRLLAKVGSRGFPTFVKFINGKLITTPYTGSRDVQSLLTFATSNTH